MGTGAWVMRLRGGGGPVTPLLMNSDSPKLEAVASDPANALALQKLICYSKPILEFKFEIRTFGCRLSLKTSATDSEKTRKAKVTKRYIPVVPSSRHCHKVSRLSRIDLKIPNSSKALYKTSNR